MKSMKFCTNAMVAAMVAATPLVTPATAVAESRASHAPAAYVAADVNLLANPATVITLRGTEVPFGDLFTGTVDQAFQGVFCEEPNVCIESPYRASIFFFGVDEEGKATLDEIVAFARGDKIILGYSRGALFAEQRMQEWASYGTGPAVDETIVVLYGNPANDNGGGSTAGQGFSPIENPYRVLDITNEYDPVSDKPKSGNLLATLNSLMAFGQHLNYRNVDINDPDNLVKVVDGHVYMIVPAKSVPLLGIFGVLLPGLNNAFKGVIDQAHDREGFERLGDRDVMDLVAGVSEQQTSESRMMTMSTGPEEVSEGTDTVEPRQDGLRQRSMQTVQKVEQEVTESNSFVADSDGPDVKSEVSEEVKSEPESEVSETVEETEELIEVPTDSTDNEVTDDQTNVDEIDESDGQEEASQSESEVSEPEPNDDEGESLRTKRSLRSNSAVTGDDDDDDNRPAVRTAKKPASSESSSTGNNDGPDRSDDKKSSGSEE